LIKFYQSLCLFVLTPSISRFQESFVSWTMREKHWRWESWWNICIYFCFLQSSLSDHGVLLEQFFVCSVITSKEKVTKQ
jgi:hypothetical protein